MANITLMGASYTDVPAVDLPKTGGGTVRFYENGGGGGVSRTVIAAQQTVTASEYFTALSASEGLTEGNVYAYTVDGTEYVGTALDENGMLYVRDVTTYAIGDYYGNLYLVTQSTGQHTVKVEKLDFSGGGSDQSLIKSADLTMSETYTNANKLTVALEARTACVILVWADELPSAPESGYTAIFGSFFVASGISQTKDGRILRANGTIGNDTAMLSFDTTTGILSLGGQYGYFREGMTYHIRQYEF